MTRNIWNEEERAVEDVPLPEMVDPTTVTIDTTPNPVLTDEEIAAIDAQIAKFEAEESLTATAEVMLKNLKAARAALGPTG